MKTTALAHFRFDIDHNQFLIYDVSVQVPQCEWTEEHSDQGFARRDSCACIATLLQDGHADTTVFFGPFDKRPIYQRVVALPFFAPEGKIIIRGLMELYLAPCIILPARPLQNLRGAVGHR